MEIRSVLLPPVLDEAQVALLASLATEIVDLMDGGLDYGAHIERFNALAARPYEAGDFHGAAGSMSMEEFARQALTRDPPYILDISRQEYLELIRRAQNVETPEREHVYWLALLYRNLGLPSGYRLGLYDLPAEQVLEKALAYKLIAL